MKDTVGVRTLASVCIRGGSLHLPFSCVADFVPATNRVENIDLAFQSRIHVSIEYPDLTAESRRTIWRNFVNSSTEKSEISESDIVELAQLSLNGRQIKNVLKTAGLLALRKRMPLKRNFIDTVLTIEKKRPGVNNGYTAQLYT